MSQSIDIVNQKSMPLAEQVFEHVHAIMHLHRSQQLRGLRDSPHELTHMEGKVLGYFARNPGATQSDLAAHARRDKAQLARLIAGLKERELLEARVDEQDRRNLRLHLTPAGQQLRDTLQQQARKLARLGMAGLSPDEGRQLLALLSKVQSSLEGGST